MSRLGAERSAPGIAPAPRLPRSGAKRQWRRSRTARRSLPWSSAAAVSGRLWFPTGAVQLCTPRSARTSVRTRRSTRDEWALYDGLSRDFAGHFKIKHHDSVYADWNIHTQTVEGFFGNVKRGLSGVQHNVSRKWLENYVNEFAFKYSHRDDGVPMFKLFLRNIKKNADGDGPSASSNAARPALGV